jgi:hypothetical protein
MEAVMSGRSGFLNVVIAIFTVIGLIAVLGVAGMAVLHVSMMHGIRFCGAAVHVRPQ